MTQVSVEEARVKELFKEALLELFQEEKDVLYDLFAEILEDIALTNAIKESEADETVDREEVFEILENMA